MPFEPGSEGIDSGSWNLAVDTFKAPSGNHFLRGNMLAVDTISITYFPLCWLLNTSNLIMYILRNRDKNCLLRTMY
jgi:hypothetical protein